MMHEIDARNKPCPQPLLMVKQQVDEGQNAFAIFVDNQAAVENTKRFGQKNGFQVHVQEMTGYWRVSGTKEGAVGSEIRDPNPAPTSTAVQDEACFSQLQTLVIQSQTLGRDDEELGRKLIAILLDTLAVNETQPKTIILLNSGVKLACDGSETLDALLDLEKKGTRILACGTCLNHFDLNRAIRVGQPSNAYEVLNTLLAGGVLVWG